MPAKVYREPIEKWPPQTALRSKASSATNLRPMASISSSAPCIRQPHMNNSLAPGRIYPYTVLIYTATYCSGRRIHQTRCTSLAINIGRYNLNHSTFTYQLLHPHGCARSHHAIAATSLSECVRHISPSVSRVREKPHMQRDKLPEALSPCAKVRKRMWTNRPNS